jgi:MFS family permease
MFLGSIVVFIVGSALSGQASSMGELIGFRALQGIGAGGMMAGAFAFIGVLLPPRERGRYQGMVAIVQAVGSIAGPLMGGFITAYLGWRWAFYVNIPIGLIAIVWCWLLLPVPPTRRGKVVIDWLGITLMTAMISALVMAATWAGSTYAWGSWQILGLGAAVVVLLIAFIAAEQRAAEPLLPPRIFTRRRNFPIAAVLLTVAGVAMLGGTLYLPLFQQTVQGASAQNSGLLLLPMMAGTSAFMILVGIGTGFSIQMANTIAQNSVELRDMGAASAATSLFRTLGGSLGVAVFGSLLTRATEGKAGTAGVGSATHGVSQAATDAYLHAVAHGTQQIFLVGTLCAAAAFLAAVFIQEVPLSRQPTGNQGTANDSARLAS